MQKAPIGTVVYAKKHATFFHDPKEIPRMVIAYEKKRTGNIIAVLDTGERVSFGELTDIPCSKMECGNCKWHQRNITTAST